MRRYLTPRSIAMHATLLVLLPVFAWLTLWQLGRALSGNTLSWAYTFEWPLFAGYAVYVWWHLVHDQARGGEQSGLASDRSRLGHSAPPATGADLEPGWALTGGRKRNVAIAQRNAVGEDQARGERFVPQTPEEAAELAAYNRYLAALNADPGSSGR